MFRINEADLRVYILIWYYAGKKSTDHCRIFGSQ